MRNVPFEYSLSPVICFVSYGIWWGLICAGIACNEYSPYSIASAGVEILEEIPNPDVVIVCCGGGGLVSGVAASIKLKGSKATRIFAVEPEGGGGMKGHVW